MEANSGEGGVLCEYWVHDVKSNSREGRGGGLRVFDGEGGIGGDSASLPRAGP